jgi:RNA polymerase sigma-70 factor (sigma-E family)
MSAAVDFDAFVVARGPALIRFAHALSGDRGLGEDLCQSVLAKAHRRWKKINGDPEPYVRAAIVHELISWRRRRSNTERPGEVPDTSVAGPLDALAERDAMWQLLRELPDRQRAVLVLRYWQGLSDAEIAGLLHCSEGTVRSSAARAFAVLRRHPDLAGLTLPADAGAPS